MLSDQQNGTYRQGLRMGYGSYGLQGRQRMGGYRSLAVAPPVQQLNAARALNSNWATAPDVSVAQMPQMPQTGDAMRRPYAAAPPQPPERPLHQQWDFASMLHAAMAGQQQTQAQPFLDQLRARLQQMQQPTASAPGASPLASWLMAQRV